MYCFSNHINHLCNICNGYDENIFATHMNTFLQVIVDMNLISWLHNYNRHSNEQWDDINTNMGQFFANSQVNVQQFNGSNTICVMMRIKWEAQSRGMF